MLANESPAGSTSQQPLRPNVTLVVWTATRGVDIEGPDALRNLARATRSAAMRAGDGAHGVAAVPGSEGSRDLQIPGRYDRQRSAFGIWHHDVFAVEGDGDLAVHRD